MTWRNRKLFGNLPQGIISGLEPIPRYQMGGMVQGYEAGGKTYPNKGLEALAKEAPEVVKRMGYEDGGFINPRNYVGGGTVGMPIGMEVGALVPEVFESGDQQINDALNNMTAMTGVSGGASENTVAPIVPIEPIVDDSVTKVEKEKAKKLVSNNLVTEITAEYQEMAQSIVQNILSDSAGTTSVEDTEKNIETRLDLLDEEYKRKVQEVVIEMDLSINKEDLGKITLLTPEFETKLYEMLAPIIPEDSVSKETKNLFTAIESESSAGENISLGEDGIPRLKHGGIHPTREEINDEIRKNQQRKEDLARVGTLRSGKSKQGGLAGLLDIYGQADIAEANAIKGGTAAVPTASVELAAYKDEQYQAIMNDTTLTDDEKERRLKALNLGSKNSNIELAEYKRERYRDIMNSGKTDAEKQGMLIAEGLLGATGAGSSPVSIQNQAKIKELNDLLKIEQNKIIANPALDAATKQKKLADLRQLYEMQVQPLGVKMDTYQTKAEKLNAIRTQALEIAKSGSAAAAMDVDDILAEAKKIFELLAPGEIFKVPTGPLPPPDTGPLPPPDKP